MTAALQGVRVLDLSRYVAGAYCAKLLAAFGAEVIKVEPPGTGDPARAVGPFLHDRRDPETSALFLYLNTGKQGLTLNLKHPQGREILKALARHSDMLIENFAPRVMPSLGLDYATLRALNPRLIMVSISNFGQCGPYRDYKANDMISYALGGYMYLNGHPQRPPLSGGGHQPAYQGGLHGYSGAMAALMARQQNGQGPARGRLDPGVHGLHPPVYHQPLRVRRPHSEAPRQPLSTRPPDYHLPLQGRPDIPGCQHAGAIRAVPDPDWPGRTPGR